jgi:hypothetical protein
VAVVAASQDFFLFGTMSSADAPGVPAPAAVGEEPAREGVELYIEYRAKGTTSLPDVAATARKWAADGEPFEGMIPAVLRTLMRPRITVFDVLSAEAGLPFSLDNGVALQELVLQRLAWLGRAPKRSRSGGDAAATTTASRRLWTERQPRTVWWEARTVRVYAWPAELREALAAACRGVLACARGTGGPERCPERGIHRGGLPGLEAACVSCTRRRLEGLRADYKCVTF